jgi:hypothetical protein
MQALEIGTRVIVRAVSTVGYIDDHQRVVIRNSIVPVDAVITGQVIRRLGRYRPAMGGGYDGDYNPAELGGSHT